MPRADVRGLLSQLVSAGLGLLLSLLIVCHTDVHGQGQRKWASSGKFPTYQQQYPSYKPTFKDTENNITVGPGDRAVLKCIVDNLGTKTVTWRRKRDKHPLTIGLFTFVGDTRITVDFNQRQSEWSLMIQDIRPSDEGIYQCQISTKEELDKKYEIRLNVRTVQVSGTEYVEKGGAVKLMCNATGKPDPPHDVEWYKNGHKVDSDASSGILITKRIDTKVLISVLVIKNSKMSHQGNYVCRSTNQDAGSLRVHILNAKPDQQKRGAEEIRSKAGQASVRSSWVLIYTSVLILTILIFYNPHERWL